MVKGGHIMKTRHILYMTLAFMATACAEELAPVTDNNSATDEIVCVPMEFTGVIETTKTTLVNDRQVNWVQGDRVSVIPAGGTTIHEFKAASATNTAYLSGEAPVADSYYAYYPYANNITLSGSSLTKCNLSPNQSGKAGTFNTQTAAMMGKSNGDKIEFRNLMSHIKFTLAEGIEGVEYIILIGNNYEDLAGQFTVDWNNGNPTVTPTGADKYVSLKNPNGGTLTAGDYYFTTFPVEFKNGFTVILQMQDGTQLAKKTTKAINALTRNQILPMAKVQKEDYADHMNYYAKYNVGKDITIGGVTFNKSTLSAKLISGRRDLNSDGLYFILPGLGATTSSSTYVRLHLQNAGTTYKNFYIIGVDRDNRSEIILQTNLLDCSNATQILANLKFTVASTSVNLLKSGSGLETGGTMVISNCSFDNFSQHPMNLTNSAKLKTFEKLVVEDSEFGFSYLTPYFFNMRGRAATLRCAEIKNNIFYAKSNQLTDFKLFDVNSGEIQNIDVSNNTFVGTEGAIMCLSPKAGTASFKFNYNLFDIDLTKDIALATTAADGNFPVSGSCQHNYFFAHNDWMTYDETTAKKVYLSLTNATNLDPFSAPERLFKSPLSTSWEPANGKFGAYEIETYDMVNQPDGSIKIGAQRADMSSATVDSSNANLASLGYSSVNAGNL